MQSATDAGCGSDQAAGLRRLLAPREMRMLPLWGSVGARVQAGIAANLAGAIADAGRQVIIVDQSRGCIPAEFNLRSRYELSHLISGDRRWSQVLLDGATGVLILPASRGLREVAESVANWDLPRELYGLPAKPDVAMFNLDVPENMLRFVCPKADWLFLADSGEKGVMPAYREIKRLSRYVRPTSLRVLMCGDSGAGKAQESFGALASTATRFLGLDLAYCGHFCTDSAKGGDTRHLARQMAAASESWKLRTYKPEKRKLSIVGGAAPASSFRSWS